MKLEVVMKNKLFTSNVDFLLSNAILFVTGLIVTFFNIHLVLTASRIIGIVSLTLGIYLLYIFFFKQITGSSPFFIGFMCFITGLIMAIKPDLVFSFLPMVIGVILIIGSLLQLKKTLLLRYNKDSFFTVMLVINILFLIAGLSLFLDPIQSLSNIIKIVGILMILYSIYSTVGALLADKYIN